MDKFDTNKWFKKQYLEETHEDDPRGQMEYIKDALKNLSPEDLKKFMIWLKNTILTTQIKKTMSDNFDLKKFLKENKSIERANPYIIKEDNEKDHLRRHINKLIREELNEMGYDTEDEEYYDEDPLEPEMRKGREDSPMDTHFGDEPDWIEDETTSYSSHSTDGSPDDTEMPSWMSEAKKKKKKDKEEEDEEVSDEEVGETEGEDDTDLDATGEEDMEGMEDVGMEGEDLFSAEEQEVINNITQALQSADKLDNPTLVTQIANTLKYAQKSALKDEE